MSSYPSYLLISNVWNEEGNIESIFVQIAKQTIKPSKWLIIDDGSTDNTLTELRDLKHKYSTIGPISIYSMPPKSRGNLDTLGIAIRTALKTINRNFDYYAKIDIDTVIPANYFENIFQEFDKDPKLMCASGIIYHDLKMEPNRRKWARGSGLTIRGWFFRYYQNEIPEVTLETWIGTLACIHGYKTREFQHIKEIQLNPTTQLTKKGAWRRGRLAYYFNFNFLTVLVRAVIAEFITRRNGKLLLQGYFSARMISWRIKNDAICRYWSKTALILDFKSIFWNRFFFSF